MQNQARTAADGSLVALVDCDTFYASCERVCRPDLEGKPIVVLSNNDGCIVARSREAKKLGIQIGEPEFQIRPLLEKTMLPYSRPIIHFMGICPIVSCR